MRLATKVGLFKERSMGIEPIDWSELYAWAALTQPDDMGRDDYEAIIFISTMYVRYAKEYNNKVVPFVPDPSCFTKHEWDMVTGAANDQYKKQMG